MLTGRIIVKGQLFGAVVLNKPVYHGHRLGLDKITGERILVPPPSSAEVAHLPVLRTFRGKEPFSRRGWVAQERVIVPFCAGRNAYCCQ